MNTPVDDQHEKTPDGQYVWTETYLRWFLTYAGKAEPVLLTFVGPPIVVTVNEFGL